MNTLANNKLLSDNKIGNVNSNNTDIFGIGKAVAAFCEYKKLKITITQQNLEPLHHLIRKDILITQTKTKGFIDKIFKLYEKSDHKISVATLRVIEYMDDALLEAIIALYDIAFDAEQKGLRPSSATQQREYLAIIGLHQLRVNLTSPSFRGKYNPALDIYKMYKSK